MMAVISGRSWSTHCFSSYLGIRSSSQDLQGALAIISLTSDKVAAGMNMFNV